MLYAVHDEEGRIFHSTMVYDPDGLQFDRQLNERGDKFVKHVSAGLLPPEQYFVASGEICHRPDMPVWVTKKVFKCGDSDSTIFRGFPRGAKCTIWAKVLREVVYPEFVVDADELEISIPVPCTYEAWFDYWPYKTCKFEVEAVA